jgi:hypothetical protein
MAGKTEDSHLVKSEKEFVSSFQLNHDGPLVIIGASEGANPELKFPVDFQIKKEFSGMHPRLVATEDEIEAAARRYRENPGSFRHSIPAHDHELFTAPFPFFPYNQPGDPGVNGFVHLARLAVTYRVTGEEIYLKRLQEWGRYLENFQILPTPDPVSIINGKKVTIVGEGNYDLLSGHILLGLAIAYDTLRGKVDAPLESAFRRALVAQATLSHADFSRFSTYPYEQNHLIIPVCGIGLAALALADELPEATVWGSFAQGLLERCFETIGHDGWFFEGIQYWNFTMQFGLLYAFASQRITGADWLAKPIFAKASRFIVHNFMPDPEFVFDFNDHGPRVETDGVGAMAGYELPWHTLKLRLNFFLPNLLNRFQHDPLLDDFIRKTAGLYDSFDRLDALFFMIWPISEGESSRAAGPVSEPPYHYFPDMDIVHWRDNWTDPNATAIAFRASAPAGHYINTLLPQYPQWKMALGHAHPDAGSFILFSRGKYLANDTGYTGDKETADHNSILVDGVGQHKGGTPWATFEAKPYAEYNKIHVGNVWLGPKVMAATAFFKDAYDDAMRLTEMRRDLVLIDGRYLVTLDSIASEIPHEYEWRLHGDRQALHLGHERFMMENGPARLLFTSLLPVASHDINPTIVETELFFRPKRSRPQQRGFHVALKSARSPNHRFLVAYNIQSSTENPDAFSTRRIADNEVELSDEKGSVTIWIGAGGGLSGSFAYILKDARGEIVSVGLRGGALATPELSLDLKGRDGAITLRRDASGTFQAETTDGKVSALDIRHLGATTSLSL